MKNLTLVIFFAMSSVFTLCSSASDIASSLRDGRNEEPERYGTVEMGLVAGYINMPLVSAKDGQDGWIADLDVAGEVKRFNIFFEAAQGSQDGLNLGYTLWHSEDWAIDFLAASMSGDLREIEDEGQEGRSEEAIKNSYLEDQDTFYLGSGFRVTRYLDNYLIQYRLVTDTWRNNGVVSTLRIGRGWQIRNWHLSTIVSAQYTSPKTTNYWLGVEEHEATERYPEFKTGDMMNYSLLFNVTKPLTEKWVWRGYLGLQTFPEEAKASPLLDNSDLSVAVFTINYVFL